MKITNPCCPECGAVAIGEVVSMKGTAYIDIYDNGTAGYNGDVIADQTTVLAVPGETGNALLTCPDGHEWEINLPANPGDPSPSTPERKEIFAVKQEEDLGNLGFRCTGRLMDLTGNDKHYRVWIWTNDHGTLVFVNDLGNTYVHVLRVVGF